MFNDEKKQTDLEPRISRSRRFFMSDELPPSNESSLNSQRWTTRPYLWRPPTDVYELEQSIVVRLEIAGMGEADFTITLQDRLLTVRGVRQDISERRAFHQMEIRYGEFACEIELPAPVVVEEAQAEYRSGFITIQLPKQLPRHIELTDY